MQANNQAGKRRQY